MRQNAPGTKSNIHTATNDILARMYGVVRDASFCRVFENIGDT